MATKAKSIKIKDSTGRVRSVKEGSNQHKKYLGQSGGTSSSSSSRSSGGSRSESRKVYPAGHPKEYLNASLPESTRANYQEEFGTPTPGTAGVLSPYVQGTPQAPDSPTTAELTPEQATGYQAQIKAAQGQIDALQKQRSVATPAAAPTPTQNRYQAGLAAAQSAGLPAPADAGIARATASSYLPAEQQDTSVVDNIFSQDPVIGQLMGGIAELLSSKNQVPSIMEDYKRLRKQSGLDDINEELIDAETILDGTEDDIRNEIQTAGGFGTESQVQAMTLSRNKNLLKRYNQLVQMKTDATNQLNTMLTLTQQDRQMAQERVNTQISAMFNMANFRQTALQNTRQQQQFMIQTMGADGYYATVSQDPRQLAMAEQIMGVAPGGLQAVAAQAAEAKAFERSLQERQIAVSESGAAAAWANVGISQQRLALDREKQAAELAGGGNQNLLGLLDQYKSAVQDSNWFTRTFNPEKNAEINTLKAQITAEYKEAKKLGTLDAGLQTLIDDTLGGGGITGFSTKAQVKAIDVFTENQGGNPYENYKKALGL